MPRADMDFVLSLAIPLPPIDEQAQIVDVLSRAESIIRLRREAQKKATELIPAIFVDMFGDPATNPRGWPVVQLGEVLAEPPVLGTMAKPSAEKREWLDLRVANIQRGSLNLDDEKWLDLSPQEIKRFALRNGDVILARAIGSLDHLGKAIVVEPDGKWTFDSHLMRIRVNREQLLPEMLTTYLETDGGRREFLSHTRRSAVQFNINGKEIRRVRLPIWPIELQRLFLRKLESVDSIVHQQSAALERAIAAFEALLARTFATNDG
jgi:type I restriction enzyme S subunit